MAYADRWLLPDGVAEILPGEAQQVENLRRQLLDLYRRWGYDLVIPPLVEYTDSLLIGLGRDLDLLTFKVTDQLSGRTLGIRADITPQTARMDAHSLRRQGVNRLCYAGHVLHTKAKSPLATRSPMQLGVELYGESSLSADSEVISLLLESLQSIGLSEATIEIGHVVIYRALVAAAQLTDDQQETLFDLLQRKAAVETRQWVKDHVSDKKLAAVFCELPNLAGGREILSEARSALRDAPAAAMGALDELNQLADVIVQRYPRAKLYFDLSELTSFRYHTGITFGAYVPGVGRSVAFGGRYDSVGKVYGRARPATGFSIHDLAALLQLSANAEQETAGIFAAESSDPAQWQAIQQLRAQGERVVTGFAEGEVVKEELNCDRQLVLQGDSYQVVAW